MGKFTKKSAAPNRLAGQLPADFLPVPVTRQLSNYSCGAAAVAAVLRYFGKHDGGERELRPDLKTNRDGTLMRNMSRLLREHGLQATVENNESMQDLAKKFGPGRIAILAIQAWPASGKISSLRGCANGHYVVLIAIDKKNAYFMDPFIKGGGYGYMPLFELHRRWRDVGSRGQCVDGQIIWVSGKPAGLPKRRQALKKIN